jgi:malate dehydrogenase (oxaloacetate-decarboxylating)
VPGGILHNASKLPQDPPIAEARRIGRLIGTAVGKQAIKDGEALIFNEADLDRELQDNIWEPGYVPYERRP